MSKYGALLIVTAISLCWGSSIVKTFSHYDRDCDGVLDGAELMASSCHFTQQYKIDACTRNIHPSQVKMVMAMIDKDNSQTISFDEFRSLVGVKDPVLPGPQQVHLSLTGTPTEMVVMWVTRDRDASVLNYGETSSNMKTATGISFTYTAGIDGWDGWIHSVTITSLTPNTLYYYIVGQKDNQSDTFTFKTPPAVVTDSDMEHFAFVGDMGTTIPMGWLVADKIADANEKQRFNMVIHAGDVCYAGVGHVDELEEIWDVWGDQVQDIAAFTPYMFAVGNHERFYNFSAYTARFLMPSKQSGGVGNFWYSLDYGHIHFTFMSTEHPYQPGSEQYLWLKQDLMKAQQNRKQYPWIIVVGHRPMYNSDADEWTSHKPGAPFQVMIEPLFIDYGVDLYICGHMHMYDRTYPIVKDGTVRQNSGNIYKNPNATLYVTQGTGGVFLDDKFQEPQPHWSAHRASSWGYGDVAVNATHLQYKFVGIWEENEIYDEFWLIKN